jgi:Arc/MetJ-type ribon-helix-helix transcriptional regulator
MSDGARFRLLSVKIPEAYYEAVRLLVERGHYVSLAEAVRTGLFLLLQREGELAALLTIIREQERALREKERILSLAGTRKAGSE